MEARHRVKQGGRVTRLPKALNPYNLGWKKNVRSIMGPNPWYWILPISIPTAYSQITGDGHTFPVNTDRMSVFLDPGAAV